MWKTIRMRLRDEEKIEKLQFDGKKKMQLKVDPDIAWYGIPQGTRRKLIPSLHLALTKRHSEIKT